MSLSNVREMRRDVQGLNDDLLTANVSARNFNREVNHGLMLLRRFSGNESIDVAVAKVQRFLGTLRMAQSTIMAFEAASGPLGWALAAVGLVATAVTASDFMLSVGE